MNHLTKNIINNYLDNDLSYDDKKYVEEHIRYCDVCKKEFNSYVKLHQILKTQTCVSPKNLSIDAIYKKAVKLKKADENIDNIILYSILSIIFISFDVIALCNLIMYNSIKKIISNQNKDTIINSFAFFIYSIFFIIKL